MVVDNKKEIIPFVGLHAHSGFSVGDGLGYPPEHMNFCFENGLPAHAFTDHGNMNGVPYALQHLKKMRQSGKDFKLIFGVEAYFIPSIADWREEYEKAKENKRNRVLTAKDINATIVEDEGRKIRQALNRRRHLVLLAQNQEGLNDLYELVSESYKTGNFYRYPRMDYEMLAKYGSNLIGSSACLGGFYAGHYWENRDAGEEAILEAMREGTRRMLEVFGDRWYGEVQWNNISEQHEVNKYTIQVCEEFDVKLISTADSHYPRPEAWKDRELYKRLAWLGKKRPEWMSAELPESPDEIGYELYPKNGDQMWEAYKRYSEEIGVEYDDDVILDSITRTHHIAMDRIEDFEPDNTIRLPSFVVPEEYKGDADFALRDLCVRGLEKRNLQEIEVYTERLEKELDVLQSQGFAKYFLTMKAVSDEAQSLSLYGPGRGSAAGSLIAYLLEITQVDPIEHDLLFERFLTRSATGMPDIDFDVCNPMRLKEHLIEKWGDNVVVPISNFNTLALRSLIKDISRFYEVPFAEANAVTSKMLLEATPAAKKKHGIAAGVYTPTFEEVMEFSETLQKFFRKYPEIKTHINALHGQIKSTSRHAGGVCIGEDLNRYMPLINSGGVRQTPWTEGQKMRHLEPMGFIKFDILGLSTIEMIEGAIENILRDDQGIENPTIEDIKTFYNKHLHPDVIDTDDQDIWKNIFHEGRFAGIFQFTQQGAQDLCVRVKPTNIVDLSAITSIFRPGPLSAGVDKDYVEAKKSPQYIKYIHPIVREHTENTYGFLIFQEQIATLAHKLGKDISLDEGNMLRKLFTKKGTGKGEEEMLKIRRKFIEGCTEKGIERSAAAGLFQTFEFFSGYGFNKSHAVSYCFISYQCAWLFHYHPAAWMAAFLHKEPETRKEKAINIAKSFGFKIEPMNINLSGNEWRVLPDGKTLVQPLTSVKGLGEKAVAQIMANRPFNTIEEFLFHPDISYSKLNKKCLDVLVRSQALNCLMDDRFNGLKHFWSAVAVDRPRKEKNLHDNIKTYAPEGDFAEEEKIEFLTDLTGVFPMSMVISQEVLDRFNEKRIPPISEFDVDLGVSWFIPRGIENKKTRNGKDYWIVSVIDSNNKITKIKCWGVKKGVDRVFLNVPYLARLDYDEQWGFSSRSVRRNFKMIG